MRSERQWRVQQLLRMAELCDAEEKERKNMYMEEIDSLMFGGGEGLGSMQDEILSVAALAEKQHPTVHAFVEHCDNSGYEFENKRTRDVYNDYVIFCENYRKKPEGINTVTSTIKRLKGLININARHKTEGTKSRGTVARVFKTK